MIKKIKKLRK